MSLIVNETKTKYLLLSKNMLTPSSLDFYVTIDSHNYEVVDDFFHLGTGINNNASLDADHSFRNKCYFWRTVRPMKYKALSWRIKTTLCKSSIFLILGVFNLKILRKIYGLFCSRDRNCAGWIVLTECMKTVQQWMYSIQVLVMTKDSFGKISWRRL